MAANQEPGRLEAAAALLRRARCAMLATVHEGQPYASLVTPALDTDGAPVLLLSGLAAHTRHLRANPACALLFTGQAVDENPQTTPRLTLTGTARPVAADEVKMRYLQIHPYAASYAGFGDFSFWKITVSTSQYIGGFGNAGLLEYSALQQEISAQLDAGLG
ncbi:MAG TPA: pyridoxamine 5'-phosphate oxidase family protein [Acidocella sp.]|nr:pyridoxamine 5'-phosphate oxidase family protein [Acidocella sp.]